MTTIKSEIVGRDNGLRSQHRLQRFHQASVIRERVHSSVGRSGNGPSRIRKITCSLFLLSEKGGFAKTVPKNRPGVPVKLHRNKRLKTPPKCHSKCPTISWEGDGIFFSDHDFWSQPVPCTSAGGIHGHAKRGGGQVRVPKVG